MSSYITLPGYYEDPLISWEGHQLDMRMLSILSSRVFDRLLGSRNRFPDPSGSLFTTPNLHTMRSLADEPTIRGRRFTIANTYYFFSELSHRARARQVGARYTTQQHPVSCSNLKQLFVAAAIAMPHTPSVSMSCVRGNFGVPALTGIYHGKSLKSCSRLF